MSEANATPTPTTPETSGNGVAIKSYDERVADAFGETQGQPGAPNAPAGPAPAPEPDANAKARAERRAAYEKLKLEERGRVDALAAVREAETLRRRVAELEAASKTRPTNLVDLDELDEDGVLGLMERSKKTTPQKIAERMRELIANPDLIATQAATRAVDPKLAALEKRLAEQQAVIDNFMTQQQTAQANAAEQHYANQFFAFTEQNAATSPLSARFLAKHGAGEYYKLAQSAVQNVPAHAGPQAILDEIEEQLTALGQIYQPDQGTPQRRPATTPQQNPAAAQAPTHVSNSLAQQRSSVIDDETEWAALPFEERSARLFR